MNLVTSAGQNSMHPPQLHPNKTKGNKFYQQENATKALEMFFSSARVWFSPIAKLLKANLENSI